MSVRFYRLSDSSFPWCLHIRLAVPFGEVIDSEVVTPLAAKSILKQSELGDVTLDSPLSEFSVDAARYNKKLLDLYDGQRLVHAGGV